MDWNAVAALLELMQDPDDDVRDWATFAIGTHPEFDSPDVRASLYRALEDDCSLVVQEAINGLVERKDDRVSPILQKQLAADDIRDETITCAGTHGSCELIPYLERVYARPDMGDEIRESIAWAIRRCRGEE
jgi:HEAT repeat protein